MLATLAKPDEAAAFCAERAPGIACYSDPDMSARKAFGLGRGSALQMFGPNVFKAGARAAAQGETMGKVVGDPWQMPGTFVINRNRQLRLAYYSVHAGDYPEDAVLLQALRA